MKIISASCWSILSVTGLTALVAAGCGGEPSDGTASDISGAQDNVSGLVTEENDSPNFPANTPVEVWSDMEDANSERMQMNYGDLEPLCQEELAKEKQSLEERGVDVIDGPIIYVPYDVVGRTSSQEYEYSCK